MLTLCDLIRSGVEIIPHSLSRTPYLLSRTPYTLSRTPYTLSRTPYTLALSGPGPATSCLETASDLQDSGLARVLADRIQEIADLLRCSDCEGIRVSSVIFVDRKVGGSKLSILESR